MEILTVVIEIIAFGYGAYYAYEYKVGPRILRRMKWGQKAAAWMGSLFGVSNAYSGPIATSESPVI